MKRQKVTQQTWEPVPAPLLCLRTATRAKSKVLWASCARLVFQFHWILCILISIYTLIYGLKVHLCVKPITQTKCQKVQCYKLLFKHFIIFDWRQICVSKNAQQKVEKSVIFEEKRKGERVKNLIPANIMCVEYWWFFYHESRAAPIFTRSIFSRLKIAFSRRSVFSSKNSHGIVLIKVVCLSLVHCWVFRDDFTLLCAADLA